MHHSNTAALIEGILRNIFLCTCIPILRRVFRVSRQVMQKKELLFSPHIEMSQNLLSWWAGGFTEKVLWRIYEQKPEMDLTCVVFFPDLFGPYIEACCAAVFLF